MHSGSSLFAMAQGWARRDGGREVIAAPDTRLTYAALARAVDAGAEALRSAGLVPGARVAFLGSPGAAFLVSELATHAAGGVWLGLNPRYTAPELAHVLADAGPSLVVVDIGHDTALVTQAAARLDRPPVIHALSRLDDLGKLPGPLARPAQLLGRDIGLLVYTSGTTGAPKGAMLTHAGLTEAARLYADRYAHDGMRTLLNLPINHVGALVDIVSPALACGGTLVTMPGFEPAAIPDLLRAERITLLGQVPAMHLAIEAAAPYDPSSLPHLKHLVWSGAAMPRSWIEARIGGRVELSTCYGQTECTGSVTFTQAGAAVDELADTVGRPAQSDRMRVVGLDGREAATGEPGEVQLRGPLLMAGYLNRPAASAEAIGADGWLRTGDLGVLDDDGCLRLVGRLKEMFKSGGYNVYPREVETALETHPAVAAAAVIAMPDDQWQEVGWGFILVHAPVTADEIEAHARARLANYKIPKRLIVANELPLLPIGKIDKQALRAAAVEGRHG